MGMTFKKMLKNLGPLYKLQPYFFGVLSTTCQQQGNIKPVFRGKGNKYNQTCSFGEIFKHCGFAVDNSLRKIGLLMLRKWVVQLLICSNNFHSKILLKSLP